MQKTTQDKQNKPYYTPQIRTVDRVILVCFCWFSHSFHTFANKCKTTSGKPKNKKQKHNNKQTKQTNQDFPPQVRTADIVLFFLLGFIQVFHIFPKKCKQPRENQKKQEYPPQVRPEDIVFFCLVFVVFSRERYAKHYVFPERIRIIKKTHAQGDLFWNKKG